MSTQDKKRILVTGGAGFVGSHLCKALLEQENHVICMDNLYTGCMANLEDVADHPDFEFIRHDVIEPFDLEVDQIFNLACPASPKHYQNSPIETIKTSIFGAFNALDLARKRNATILQTSTSEVYGDPFEHPQKESYWGNVNPIGLRACYDEGKRCSEAIFMNYHRAYGVDIRIIRIFNTYGPHMAVNDNRVVSNFIVQALRNEDITIYGSGDQTRSFQYVDDLIRAMILMMNQKDFIGPVNLGNPGEFTMLELAELVIKLTGSKSKLVFHPLPADDPVRRKPDISLAKSKLDWQPVVSLEEGLAKTIEYFRKVLGVPAV